MRINLTKKDLVNLIYMQIGFSKQISENLIEDFFDIIVENLKNEKILKLSKFGTFSIRQKKTRIGRNPKTKEIKIISERNVVLFKPSKEFKNFFNKIGSTITLKTSPNDRYSSGLSYKISCCQDLGSLSSFSVYFLAIPEKYSIYLDEFGYYGEQLLRSSCNKEKIKNKIGIDSIKNMKAHNLLKEKMEDCYKATKVKLKYQLSILLNSDDIIPMNLTINLRTPVQKTNLKF